ncbi:ABC transporter substrate-binding protein [Virgisporangium aurantiacum]|uniref:Aliphatic sulfonate ABC transporter substrate-binding protein n=1 Tax=Virgisporangium aurantiacum TaxID=175570 RepID=A0A8J4E2U4_9ACTN|nr:ABC transporter substrate-binding protein [Virgisporangium aurantiacum]GIJ59364.1 aliphatic sulfonate ABC transporter substrate-binding protein [Virgisporangium aurantiacum]
MYRPSTPAPVLRRRTLLASLGLGAAAIGLGACAEADAGGLENDAPLPTEVDPATALSISIRTTQKQLEGSGLIGKLPFQVKEWINLGAGPDIIQGFRAKSIDIANNAGIPPIQARAINVDAKIVAVQSVPIPIYKLATIPGSGINSLADIKGKKIAFSQGQAQGVVVLRTIKELGLKNSDVTLVPLTSNQFFTALQSKQVDAAPLGEPSLTKYISQFGRDGAKAVDINAVDYLSVLWAPGAVLADPKKAAAVRSFIPFWVQGAVWGWENQSAYIDVYFVKDQQVTTTDGQRILAASPKPVFPTGWDKAIAWEQETADLLADGGYVPKIKATDLFDRRFEKIASEAAPAGYRE